jgi:hypothetical protein
MVAIGGISDSIVVIVIFVEGEAVAGIDTAGVIDRCGTINERGIDP